MNFKALPGVGCAFVNILLLVLLSLTVSSAYSAGMPKNRKAPHVPCTLNLFRKFELAFAQVRHNA